MRGWIRFFWIIMCSEQIQCKDRFFRIYFHVEKTKITFKRSFIGTYDFSILFRSHLNIFFSRLPLVTIFHVVCQYFKTTKRKKNLVSFLLIFNVNFYCLEIVVDKIRKRKLSVAALPTFNHILN